jgi:hypothetical protein
LLFNKNNPAPYLGASTLFLFPPSTGPFVAFLILRFTCAILQPLVAPPNFIGISRLTFPNTYLCEIAAWETSNLVGATILS